MRSDADAPMDIATTPAKVLVFRPGQLGDTVAAVPALNALRSAWPGTHVTLLYDTHSRRGLSTAKSVLEGSGLVDAYVSYSPAISRLGRAMMAARLTANLRPLRFDTFVYLAPSLRTPEQRKRDMMLPRLCGISRIVGDIDLDPKAKDPIHADRHAHESDLLLRRLSSSGIPVPGAHEGCMDLRLTQAERHAAETWRTRQAVPPSAVTVAFAPGSKMPSKRWPIERFFEVGKSLIESRDIWPLVFGGPEEAGSGRELVARWGRGGVASGALGVRESAAAMAGCRLFLGNDSGAMHLAAAVGVPCVALFSARDLRGTWYPYGRAAHRVFRESIDCEGCMLVECVERANECLLRIDVARVTEACLEVLSRASEGAA